MVYSAGYYGEGVRSDCQVSLEITSHGGISVHLVSKVKTLYGKSIYALIHDMLNYFDVSNARVEISDQGALPFTLAARLEAVIHKAAPSEKSYLVPVLPQNQYTTSRWRERITRLYLPGNNPKLMINAGIYGSNGIILDLEDSVAPGRKHEARYLVRNALRSVDFYGAERMVRINQLPEGLEDLEFCIPHHVNLILVPKCESRNTIELINERIQKIAGKSDTGIHLMPIIESAAGVLNAYEIAAAKNVVALAIGLEDYTADIGTPRTEEGRESYFARSMVVNAAVAAGVQPIDSVFADIDNMDALAAHAAASKAMGFTGMGCIHPRQVKIIQRHFLPSEAEIEKAKKITLAAEKAEQEGSAVVALESKMIDPPVVKRAMHIINSAVNAGLLSENWRTML